MLIKLIYEVSKIFSVYAAFLFYGDVTTDTITIYDVQSLVMSFSLNIDYILYMCCFLILVVCVLIIKEFYNVRLSNAAGYKTY